MKTAVILLISLCAAAETQEERGRRIVDQALQALGGEKFLAMRDRVEAGRGYSFFREELSGLSRVKIYTRYLKPELTGPGRLLVRERQSFGENENSGAVLFTDGKGYQITFRGARPVPQDTLDRYALSMLHNIFYILRFRLNEPGLIIEHQKSEIFENQQVEIVDITDSENRTVTVYFQKSTGLPVRQVFYRRDPVTRERIEEVTVYSKFRDAGGGVQWPFTIERERNGEKVFELYAESVQVNQGLSDNLFLLPANIKVLKK